VDTLAAIVDLVTHGKANMSAYGDRLTSDEIVNVSSYVLQQAQTGWTP
jgi:cytochrome c6